MPRTAPAVTPQLKTENANIADSKSAKYKLSDKKTHLYFFCMSAVHIVPILCLISFTDQDAPDRLTCLLYIVPHSSVARALRPYFNISQIANYNHVSRIFISVIFKVQIPIARSSVCTNYIRGVITVTV